MRANKEKSISQATIAIATTPAERHPTQRTKQLAKSPHSSSINMHLADINRPTLRIDNILQALQPTKYAAPNPDKDSPMMAPILPTTVAIPDGAPVAPEDSIAPQDNTTETVTQSSPLSRSVRISKTATTGTTTGGIPQGTAITPHNATHKSILLSSARSASTNKDLKDDNNNTPTNNWPREIHDRDQKLYQVFSNNGLKKTAYHVTDFTGFYLIWPIVEFSMAPTGASKDKRMASFIRCVTALLGEMLYVDDTAMITPIHITDDNAEHFIKSKTEIPSNFTKLGKHIMISSGSWVFNKKEKGSNNVYGRFRLKSQIPTEDIINRVSFKFSRVWGKTSSRNSTKQ